MKKFNLNIINLLNLGLVIAVICSFFYQLYLVDISSVSGRQLSEYNDVVKALEKENNYLNNDYLQLTSISNIKARVVEAGFVSANLEYLSDFILASR